jgi:hypothetical protein
MMGTFRLKRKTKTFGFLGDVAHAKGDNWAITKDIFKNEGVGAGLKSMFWRGKDQLQRSVDRLAASGNSEVANRIVRNQNRLGIGGKIQTPTPTAGVPSTNASIAMGAPAGPSIGGTGAGVGGY